MKKRKILYIGNKLSSKGKTPTVMEELGLHLEHEGHEVVYASSYKNKGLRFMDMYLEFRKHKKSTQLILIDTYSTLNFYYALVIGFLSYKNNIPYIPILHGGNLEKRLLKNKKSTISFFKNAATLVAPSLFLKEIFKKYGYKNTTYIANSIPISNYPFDKKNTQEIKLLWVRSFHEIYNPKLAILILQKLIALNYQATLVMVGPPKDNTFIACKKIVEKHSLPVTFTGMLPKKEWIALSKNTTIFINTSTIDNTPVSIVEAMALGFPIVSSNIGGIPYLIKHENTGLLVDYKDVNAYTEGIIRIHEHQDFANYLGENARKKAEEFDWKHIKKSWNTIINEHSKTII